MSAMRSASSRTATRTSPSSMAPLADEVLEATGAGDDDVDALVERPALLLVAGAAVDGEHRAARDAERAWASSSATWAASSRVGTSTRAQGRRGAATSRRAAMARPKARVLPEPVGARPQTSRPARASGSAAAWMGNGASMPRDGEVGGERGGDAELREGGRHGGCATFVSREEADSKRTLEPASSGDGGRRTRRVYMAQDALPSPHAVRHDRNPCERAPRWRGANRTTRRKAR